MPPDQITLTFTPALYSTIMTALSNLPFKDAAGPINEIQRQVQAQMTPPPMPRPMGVAPPAQAEVPLPVKKQG